MRVVFVALTAAMLASCAAKVPLTASPPSGLDLASIDPQIRPQDDLYRHTNGRWLSTTEIPADRSNYAKFLSQSDAVQAQLRTLIEEAAASPEHASDSERQKLGDLYRSFMDEARLESLGLAPVRARLAAVDAVSTPRDLAKLFGQFARVGVASAVFYAIGQDPKVATQYIASVGQAAPYSGTPSGLGLPDRDYYLLDEPRFIELRQKYVAHVERMLQLAEIDEAERAAHEVLKLETEIARIQWTRVADRDEEKVYNKFALAELDAVIPGFDWSAYLREVGAGRSPGLIVRQPSYFTALAALMRDTELSVWKAHAKFHVLSHAAPMLDKGFVDAHFEFHGRTLAGIQEQAPRWKRAVEATDRALGEALGRLYVQRHFPPQAKARVEVLVGNLVKAYEQSIRALDWMSAQTKDNALEKLSRMSLKVGYPDRWKDYSTLLIQPDDLYGNITRAAEHEFERQRAKLGAPIDRGEWAMTPQTFNAYYHPSLNEMVFPAAFLQPPFFHLDADDAVNYGGIGSVIGHEIGHGFDDQGSKYDADGNLKSWWTEVDRKAFDSRAQALIAQYDAYCPLPGRCVSGALTVGENIGDLGGLSIAYEAYRLSLQGREAPTLDGYTGDQRFFLGWAQAWARKYREEELLTRLKTDPHSPSEYRTNGPAANVPAFHSAFDIKPGDAMYRAPEQRVKIW
jgi:putative endopeptidase